jgi:hypothetical protein
MPLILVQVTDPLCDLLHIDCRILQVRTPGPATAAGEPAPVALPVGRITLCELCGVVGCRKGFDQQIELR